MVKLPFIHQLSDQQAEQWRQQLQLYLPGIKVCDLIEMSRLECEQVEVAVVANPAPEQLSVLPRLKWVHSVWAGVERMMAALRHSTVDIVRLIDPALAQTMAEAVLAWVMYLHRDMPSYMQQQQQKCWQPLPMKTAEHSRVLVLGLGELGCTSARRLAANGFLVSGWSRSQKQLNAVTCYAGENGLQQALGQADILVNLLPLTQATRGLLNMQLFSQMPAGASLINFGRGASLNETELLSALANGQLNHAVLDVFEQEPLASDSPLWSNPNVTVLDRKSTRLNSSH